MFRLNIGGLYVDILRITINEEICMMGNHATINFKIYWAPFVKQFYHLKFNIKGSATGFLKHVVKIIVKGDMIIIRTLICM